MLDIFNYYNTGNRAWTFSRKRFTEGGFRTAFSRLLPNDILHDAALAFLHVDHIDVLSFCVPMGAPNQTSNLSRNLRRNVLFIERPGSDYWTMFSFMWRQRPGVVGGIVQAFAENAHTGNISEYDILDMVEPMNEGHQGALMETWFDIDNWFEILRIHELENIHDIDAIENITNGRAPRDLDARADEFVPEIAHILQEQQEDWMQPPPDFQQPQPQQQQEQHQQQPVRGWDVRMLVDNNINNDNNIWNNVIPVPPRRNIV
jgi:hypothetical protein